MRKQIKGNEYMEIEAKYDIGGMNYFSGNNEQRGYWVHFSNIESDGVWTKYTPMDEKNFKIFIKKAKRFSQKQLNKINNFLENNKDKLFKMYLKLEKNKIYNFLKENFKE